MGELFYNSIFSGPKIDKRLSEISKIIAGSVKEDNITLRSNRYYKGYGISVGSKYIGSEIYAEGLACAKLSVSEGEVYRYNGVGTDYVTSYIITDLEGIVTRISTNSFVRLTEELVIQEGEAVLYVSFNQYDSETDYLKRVILPLEYLDNLNAAVENNKQDISILNKELADTNTVVTNLNGVVNPKIELNINSYYKGYGYTTGDVFEEKILETSGVACKKINVNAGEKYLHKGQGSDYVIKYIIVNADGVITRISGNQAFDEETIVIDEDEKIMYANFNAYNSATDSLRLVDGISKPLEVLDKQVRELMEIFYPKLSVLTGRYYKKYGYNVGDEYPGTQMVAEGFACVKIKVTAGDRYTYRGGYNSDYVNRYIICDSNDIITRISTVTNKDDEEIIIKDNEAVMYVSFNGYDTKNDYIQEFKQNINISGNKPLLNKNIVCFGDSITEFSYGGKGVTDYIAELSGANIINVAIGGSRLSQRAENIPNEPNSEYTAYAAHDLTALVTSIVSGDYTKLEYAANWLKENIGDDNTSIVTRLKSIDWNRVDAVTILIGTNDYWGGASIGTTDDNSLRTIRGAINYVVQNLLTQYPHLTVYWFTPVPRWMASSLADRTDENWAGNKDNSTGNTLLDYVDAIVEQCRLQGIPVCDTYRTIGWTKYNLGNYLLSDGSDGVHPYLGFDVIAKKILSFISANNVL